MPPTNGFQPTRGYRPRGGLISRRKPFSVWTRLLIPPRAADAERQARTPQQKDGSAYKQEQTSQ